MTHFFTEKPIRKAVFPAAGLGTRFLPATKVIPKEMLPLVDKPLIQYAVEEAKQASIEEFILIINKGKEVLKDHFIANEKLAKKLVANNKTDQLIEIQSFELDDHKIRFVYQEEPLGLGHAVWCAKELIGHEPFAVLSCDDVFFSPLKGCLSQMVDCYNEKGGNIIVANPVPRDQTYRYGILAVDNEQDQLTSIRQMVEKPKPEEAPSTLSIRGRYILQPSVFDYLDQKQTGAGGEIQLTDAISNLLGKEDVYAYRFDGKTYDCGTKIGFVKATLDVAMQRDDMKAEISKTLSLYK